MPSRDVFRLLHQVRARDGRQFLDAAKDFYDSQNEHGRDFTISFLSHFDFELNKVQRQLDMPDVPLSRVLGEVLRAVRGDGL